MREFYCRLRAVFTRASSHTHTQLYTASERTPWLKDALCRGESERERNSPNLHDNAGAGTRAQFCCCSLDVDRACVDKGAQRKPLFIVPVEKRDKCDKSSLKRITSGSLLNNCFDYFLIYTRRECARFWCDQLKEKKERNFFFFKSLYNGRELFYYYFLSSKYCYILFIART